MSEAAGVPPCTHRPTCPGCPRYARSGIDPAAHERLQALARESGARLDPAVEGRALGHRHRARLMVRGRPRTPKIGLFQAGSHRIADIPHCHVHHPLVNEAAAALKRAIRATGEAPYADAPHRGRVRALQVVVERASQTAQVVLVTNDPTPDPAAPLLDALRGELGERLHSLWWNGNPQRGNVILGEHWHHVCGPDATCERIGGAQVFYPPGAFGQSHLDLADRLVEAVHAAVPPGARVAEFHAGCGAIGLGLLARGHDVVLNELESGSLAGLERGLRALPAAARKRATLRAGPAEAHAAAVDRRDVAILDPPRKGLDATLRGRLAQHPPARVLYVSCDLTSLERDADALQAGRMLALRRLTPFALFPFTRHVETLAVFERTDQPPSLP